MAACENRPLQQLIAGVNSMTQQRSIVARTSGSWQGPVTRLMSPGDMGQLIKPFIFLDYVEARGAGPKFGFHPHSGIATLTFPLSFDLEHTTSTGQVDVVRQGGIEWVMTGGGIWHKAQALSSGTMLAFQTWFAMPPSHELATASAQFLQPQQVPRVGPVTVLLGSYDGAVSQVNAPLDATYLWVQLQDGESWTYTSPATHDVAWAFAQSGNLLVSGETLSRELVVFEEGSDALHFQAQGHCAFLVGSAAKYPHDLSTGYYSVHSNPQALAAGEQRIREIGLEMKQQGMM